MLKGLAIVAVVMLHVLSSLPGRIFTQFPLAQWFIPLDQLGRFSVPVFIGLSGFALARRYQNRLELVSFYWKRILKLIPLYLLWTVGLHLLFKVIPAWYTTDVPVPWWQVVLLGSGDYQLYFVPLIFQLYLLFPLLQWLTKRLPLILLVAVGIQVASIIGFSQLPTTPPWQFWATDQAQYLIFISWLGYFVWGIQLGLQTVEKQTSKWALLSGWLVWAISLSVMSRQAILQVSSGIDPLEALKFTRLVVVPYGLASVYLAVKVGWEQLPLPEWLFLLWEKVGRWSFIIYLSHTLVLRLIFARDLPGVTWMHLVLASTVFAGGVWISGHLERPHKS